MLEKLVNAMMQEAAELSGNFCRELSFLEGDEGILVPISCVKNMKYVKVCHILCHWEVFKNAGAKSLVQA